MSADMCAVAGRTAIVTGAAKGIGLSTAVRLLSGGANCLLVDHDQEALRAAMRRLPRDAGKARPFTADISLWETGDQTVASCLDQFGRLDMLVNNAGIFPNSPTLDMSEELLRRVLDTNLVGLISLSRAVGATMVAQGDGGAIVNVASIDSLHPSMEGLAAYDASKGGVLMFTKAFALEMAPHRIRVNAVAPGAIATEGTSQPVAGLTSEEMEIAISGFLDQVPLGRMGTPDEIAKIVQVLLSEAASYMTGSMIVVDGGRLLR